MSASFKRSVSRFSFIVCLRKTVTKPWPHTAYPELRDFAWDFGGDLDFILAGPASESVVEVLGLWCQESHVSQAFDDTSSVDFGEMLKRHSETAFLDKYSRTCFLVSCKKTKSLDMSFQTRLMVCPSALRRRKDWRWTGSCFRLGLKERTLEKIALTNILKAGAPMSELWGYCAKSQEIIPQVLTLTSSSTVWLVLTASRSEII